MRSSAVVLLLLLHLLIVINSSSGSSSSAREKLGSFLLEQYRLEPHASNDSFNSIPSWIKQHMSTPSAIDPPPKPSTLLSYKVSVPISIKLVGSAFSSASSGILAGFLSSVVSSDHYHVITPFSATSHSLSISHALQIDVDLSLNSLSNRLSETLKTNLQATTAPLRSPLASIPYAVVDQIIKEDYLKQNSVDQIYVYILNLGSQSKPYAYSYTTGDSSPGVTKCLGSIWTGNDRYLWIDLGAGPVDYGPALSGDGLLPKGDFHPLAKLHGRPKSEKALLADLASLVWSAYQVLLVPSLRIPVPFEESLVVQFIHMRGSVVDNSGLSWKSIENNFMNEIKDNGLLFRNQKLSFKTYEVKLSECSICSFAIARSTVSYTSRYLFDNYTLIVSEYLDSKRLHQTISESSEEFKRLAGLPDDDFGRVLPVYVFDLDVNANLLLDRYHQSVSFKDMVIAVRTGSTQTVSDYTCNGRHVFTQTRQLERPLVGSILQSMWGVSPTHLVWSPRHNSTLVDYTWSTGQTPFGPFSEISSLSFIQKDAARRNFLLTTLNYSISSALVVLDSIASHGGERAIFRGNQQGDFLLRWRFYEYKLDKAVSALSHFDFEMALYYMTSSAHDLYAMHSLVYRASQHLEASLLCFKDPPFPWASVSLSVGVVFAVLYTFAKRDKLFRNKRKQF